MNMNTSFFLGSGNLLLQSLTASDAALLAPHLEAVELPLRCPLVVADHPITHVYFPGHGLASVTARTHSGSRSDVALFGRDGMSGVAVVLGSDSSPFDCAMQIPGAGHRIAVKALRQAMADSPTLRARLLAYAHVAFVQTGFTAVANAALTLEPRLARWLLMTQDRVDGNQMPLTHERLARILAVRRSSVTLALQELEGRRLIRADRGSITILDRKGVVAAAAGSYGRPELEYENQIGPMSPPLKG
jgi:CRP-like cAMP-binding protein